MFGKSEYIRSLEKRFDDLFQLFTHTVEASAKAMTDLRREYEVKIEAERTRSRVQEQMLLDRLLSQAGVPQMYNTVQSTFEEEPPQSQGYAPGIASVLSMQQFEDGLFQKELLEQAKALAEAQQQESAFAIPEPSLNN